uniref:NB-ARC domain-containing protein n=1 Tax=Manihot esculenta TaxID=3983 RepID=A0A199UAD7_MANES
MAREIILSVLGKISNLLIQESDSLLGVEDQIQCIETQLRKKADISDKFTGKTAFIETVYDLEDVIDQLIIKSAQRRIRYACIRSVMAFVHLPMSLFYILALVDLLDCYRLREKLEKIKIRNSKGYGMIKRSGYWHKSFGIYEVGIGYSVISPVMGLFEALATQQELRPDVRRQARRLRDKFRSLHDILKYVEQSKELSEAGMAWMEELCDVCRSAENVVGFFMQHMKNGRGGPFQNLVWAPRHVISQHKLSRQMARINDKIRDLSGQRLEAIVVSWSDNSKSLCRKRKPHPLDADQLDIVSFHEDVDAVTAQLLKDDPRCITISIVGFRGVGKTSLAKLIYESQTIVDHFPRRIWVSNVCQLRQVVNDCLLDEKHFIVVDDKEAGIEFLRNMGRVFNDISNGTRLLFTVSNLREAPPVTETSLTYSLHLRSHDESWALFTHTLKVNICREMENLKGHIIRKCGGLPWVIVELSELLSQKDATLKEWSKVLDHLNQDQEPWLKILDEINKHLPLHLRRCLFYFGLFPAGFKIPARRLIALWVAEGLGRQQSNEQSPEYVAEACLIELMNYNMVQVTEKKLNGKVKTCCLPEALLVHWFSKAKEANFLQGHSDVSNSNIGVIRRLADHLQQSDAIFDDIHGYSNASLYSRYRDVVSFLSFDTREGSRPGEDIGNFLDRSISSKCFRFLWVLDLENVYKPKLPKAVGQLTCLRYFGLRSTYLEMLTVSINKLLNLQTLDLKRTFIDTLPSSIWKMQKLRHLFLDESFHNALRRQEDSSLVDLQTLWGAFVDEDSPVRNGLDTSLNITKLGMKCKISVPSQNAAMSLQLDNVANWVVKLKQLQCLRLKSFDESGQPWDLQLQSLIEHVKLSNIYLVGKLKNQHLVSELPKSLIELTLSASGLVEDPMQALYKLPNLKIIRLLSKSFIGKKMLCSFGGFPKLEILKLWELELLEEWNVEEGALPSLKDLEIRSCRNLKMLPHGLQHVGTLRELKLTKLPMVSSRIKDNLGGECDKIAHIRHVWKED